MGGAGGVGGVRGREGRWGRWGGGGRATAEYSPLHEPNNKRRLSLTVLRDNYFMATTLIIETGAPLQLHTRF